VLLERIRAERAALGEKKRRSPRKAKNPNNDGSVQ